MKKCTPLTLPSTKGFSTGLWVIVIGMLSLSSALAQTVNAYAVQLPTRREQPLHSTTLDKVSPLLAMATAESGAETEENSTPYPVRSLSSQRSKGTVVRDFFAERIDTEIRLSWITPQEMNMREFMIERTVDGKSFTVVGEVESKGNSLNTQNYAFVDPLPINGFTYYCLTSIDIYGKKICWGLVETRMNEAPDLRAWPNPATQSDMHIEIHFLSDKKVDWQVFNLDGNIVLSGKGAEVRDGRFELHLNDYPDLTPGLYIVSVKGSHNVYTEKILVKE